MAAPDARGVQVDTVLEAVSTGACVSLVGLPGSGRHCVLDSVRLELEETGWAVTAATGTRRSVLVALLALEEQTVAPGHVMVVADNCDDGTAQVAHRHAAQVVLTQDNHDRKAGALNQALGRLAARRPTYVLVLDADTRLAPEFVEKAVATLEADPRVGAVSGLFVGDRPHNLLERFQANEYAPATGPRS